MDIQHIEEYKTSQIGRKERKNDELTENMRNKKGGEIFATNDINKKIYYL